jgi:hypothetical protein
MAATSSTDGILVDGKVRPATEEPQDDGCSFYYVVSVAEKSQVEKNGRIGLSVKV